MITGIPEVNTKQLELVTSIANSSFSKSAFVLPDSSKDVPDEFANLVAAQLALDHLESIGMVENVTAESGELLEALQPYERGFRVFAITKLGASMFAESLSENYNKPN